MSKMEGKNDNWGTCPKCGQPVMIDPKTGVAEPCATCLSSASPTGRTLGTLWILACLAAIAILVAVCIQMLL